MMYKEDSTPREKGTYVLDPESASEMARIINIDRFTTRAIGGPIKGLPELPGEAQVLDIACGPGGWVLELAFERPDFSVAGIDISNTMIAYARAQAKNQQITNASFEVMNALHPLEFSDHTFDLVNARLTTVFVPREFWPRLLAEYFRIVKPGGIVRLTEADSFAATNSLAYEEYHSLVYQAVQKRGLGFSPNGHTLGITPMLPNLLQRAGFQEIELKTHTINFSSGTDAWHYYYKNTEIACKNIQPLLLKFDLSSQEKLDQLYKQMLIEMCSEDFCGLVYLLSAWGTKPAE